MQEKIYFISGLGADERVFVNLKIEAPFQKHIKWETPYANETLSEYCKRLLLQIDLHSPVVLIGLSFGGIVAQEIAKIIPVKKLIILSSIKNEKEMGWQLRLVRATKIYKLFPASVLKFLNKFTAGYYFGTETKEEDLLLQKIIKDSDPVFLKWAIDRLMKWQNTILLSVFHIHGTHDRIFPARDIKDYLPIRNGGHFMILNKAEELSSIINNYLKA